MTTYFKTNDERWTDAVVKTCHPLSNVIIIFYIATHFTVKLCDEWHMDILTSNIKYFPGKSFYTFLLLNSRC